MPLALVTEFAFTADVAVGAALVIEGVPNGVRRYIPITGGSVAGPLLNGKVLAAGGDSQIVRADGVIELEARYLIQSDDNVLLSILNRGLRHGPAPIMSLLSRGENVPPDSYYFRAAPQLEAPRGSRYEDFNKSLFVATGERKSNSVVMHFYRVK
jgi:Protein of unknown function (DUF3237)